MIKGFIGWMTYSLSVLISTQTMAFPTSPEYPTYNDKVQCFEAVFERYDSQVQDILQYAQDDAKPHLLDTAQKTHLFENKACDMTYGV